MDMTLALAALFLPLFPLSIGLNLLLARLRVPAIAALLLLVWPQVGVALLRYAPPELPSFLPMWVLASSAFYALRLLTVRDLALWTGFLACSALALLWLALPLAKEPSALHLYAFLLGAGVASLALMIGPLTRRLGAAYAGLYLGLAEQLPRLAGVLTLLVLGAIATPPSPGFFVLWTLLQAHSPASALGVLLVWLIWGWGAICLLQDFLTGQSRSVEADDLGRALTLAIVFAFGIFTAIGLRTMGSMP